MIPMQEERENRVPTPERGIDPAAKQPRFRIERLEERIAPAKLGPFDPGSFGRGFHPGLGGAE